MAITESVSVEQVVIDRIKVAKTQTPLDEKIVKQLVKTFPVKGLPTIIVCRPAPQMGVHLVWGRNELEACRRLGRRLISARVEKGGEPEARRWREIAEIDIALSRNGVVGGTGAAQRAKLVSRRKDLYEMLHPGVPGFEQDTADRTGRARVSVVRDMRRATSLGNDVLNRITGTSLDEPSELDALAQMDRIERADTVERASRGEDVSAKAQEPTPGLGKLLTAWNVASVRGREKFLMEVGLTYAREALYATR